MAVESLSETGIECDGEIHYTAAPEETPSETAIAALTKATGRATTPGDGEALTPLFESIDPDALDALFRTGTNADSAGSITFTHDGFEITVTADGDVCVAAL